MSELDLSAILRDYERQGGRGQAAYHPVLLTRLLLSAYATGQPSSRKIEQATYDSVPYRSLAANQHPDHDTIAAFRQRHLTALAALFVQVLRLCDKAGLANKLIETYGVTAQSNRANRDQRRSEWEKIKALDYRELKPKLAELRAYWLAKWGEQADSQQLEQAAQELLNAHTPEQQIPALRIFARRRFPLDHAVLLQLTESHDERVALAAATALTEVTHASVRELAFRLVEIQGAGREQAIAMLAQNFASGDHDVVTGWLQREQDREVRHRLGMDLRNFSGQHPEPESEVRMLLTLYEKGPCSFCRESVVQRLLELDGLDAALRAECIYDANEDIRQLLAAEPESDVGAS